MLYPDLVAPIYTPGSAMTPIRATLSRPVREATTCWRALKRRTLDRLDDCPFGYSDWDLAADLISRADKEPRST